MAKKKTSSPGTEERRQKRLSDKAVKAGRKRAANADKRMGRKK